MPGTTSGRGLKSELEVIGISDGIETLRFSRTPLLDFALSWSV